LALASYRQQFSELIHKGVFKFMKFFTTVLLAAALAASAVAAPKAPTKDPAVKIVNGPRVEGTGANWAVIAWSTNTGGSTVVRYGTDPKNLNQTAEAPYSDNEKAKAQNHRVHLKNLKPNTKYFFMVDSGQGEGTGTEAKSGVSEFTTKGK
jgi:phosphodiesterase/alkaline phosphatase D-like protein